MKNRISILLITLIVSSVGGVNTPCKFWPKVSSIPVGLRVMPCAIVIPLKEQVFVDVPGSYSDELFFVKTNGNIMLHVDITPRADSIKEVNWDAKIHVRKEDPLREEIFLTGPISIKIRATITAEFKNSESIFLYKAGEHPRQADLILTIIPAMP